MRGNQAVRYAGLLWSLLLTGQLYLSGALSGVDVQKAMCLEEIGLR